MALGILASHGSNPRFSSEGIIPRLVAEHGKNKIFVRALIGQVCKEKIIVNESGRAGLPKSHPSYAHLFVCLEFIP